MPTGPNQRRGSAVPVVVVATAIVVGLFLAVASHALHWSQATTIVVGGAFAVLLGAFAAPLIMIATGQVRTRAIERKAIIEQLVKLVDERPGTAAKPGMLSATGRVESRPRGGREKGILITPGTGMVFNDRRVNPEEPVGVNRPVIAAGSAQKSQNTRAKTQLGAFREEMQQDDERLSFDAVAVRGGILGGINVAGLLPGREMARCGEELA